MTTRMGYLPNDKPPLGRNILLGLQHVLTMFPATVFVALFTGFHVSTVLLASGVSTIVALLLSRQFIGKFIPLFYGSSFSYIAAYQIVAKDHVAFGPPANDEVIGAMQAGIIVTGILNIIVGFVIRAVGKNAVDKVLPPVVTGSVAAVIGFALGFAALNDLSADHWGLAVITLVATILFSVYLQGKGFIGMLPVLLGAIVGYVIGIPMGANFAGAPGLEGIQAAMADSQLIAAPHLTMPIFSGELAAIAIVSISIMAIATIPESTAHLYQISLYVDKFAEETNQDKYELDQHVGFNLILDGIGDFINGLMGATAGTNYGENNSLMAITRNYSGPALIAAGVISMLLAFVGLLSDFVGTVPLAVSGGLAIYLFGVIGMQGIALMVENKVNLFDPKTLAVGAVIMVVGIGGHIGYGGFIPIPVGDVFPSGLPAIATGAVAGILLNAVFLVFKPPANDS